MGLMVVGAVCLLVSLLQIVAPRMFCRGSTALPDEVAGTRSTAERMYAVGLARFLKRCWVLRSLFGR